MNRLAATNRSENPGIQAQLDNEMSHNEGSEGHFSRRSCLAALSGLGIGSLIFQKSLASQVAANAQITSQMIADAQWVAGEELTEDEQSEVANTVQSALQNQAALREYPVDADTPIATAFCPHFFADPKQAVSDLPELKISMQWSGSKAKLNETEISDEAIAFASVEQLGHWIRAGKISSVKMTQLYLERLHRYNPLLNCVVNFADDIAMRQARRADAELAAGTDRGPLHGIPWAAKDIIAIPGIPTTWGVDVYESEQRQTMATVAKRLESAGAVLLAKVSVGTMAWGDEWFGGVTKNPWNPKQGSSGSSAGSASAVAAGLCGFAIGTETLGSIVSPTRRCRVTGLRPTFGRVSRAGCMTLGWTLDKIGPIVRYAEDCAAVLAAIMGADGHDPTVVHREFAYPPRQSVESMKIGFVKGQMNRAEQLAKEKLESVGAELVEISYESAIPESALMSCLDAEATTMHDDLYRREDIEEKTLGKWGPVFRGGQWIPAVHFLKGLRARTSLIADVEKKLSAVDCVIGGNDLVTMNLTGHPSMVVAIYDTESSSSEIPQTVKLTAKMFADSTLVAVGNYLQQIMPSNHLRPDLDRFLSEMMVAESVEKIDQSSTSDSRTPDEQPSNTKAGKSNRDSNDGANGG